MAEIPREGSTWRRGRAHGTVERVWQEDGQWFVRVKLDYGSTARMDAGEFLKQFRWVSEAPETAAVSEAAGG